MTAKPTKARIARGTLAPQDPNDRAQLVLPMTEPPIRMTIKPPRFTTTTPGVIRRNPR
jgi:hypothetical protein